MTTRMMLWLLAVMAPLACSLPQGEEDPDESSASLTASASLMFEAETMSVNKSAGGTFSDATASGGRGLVIWSQGTAKRSLSLTSHTDTLSVTARGDSCDGAPKMSVTVDGVSVLSVAVDATTAWKTYSAPVPLSAGAHTVKIAFDNDFYAASRCDRNLRLDRVDFGSMVADAGTPPPPHPPAPPPPPSGAHLLFASGFEPNTTLAPYTTNDFQAFSGTDTSTGFTWPTIAGGKLTMHQIRANNQTSLITDLGHNGASTRMLYNKLDGTTDSTFCCPQSDLELSQFPNGVGPMSYYQRFWVKYPTNPHSYGGSDWTTVAEYKTADGGDSVVQKLDFYLYGLGSTPYWYLGIYDNLAPQHLAWGKSNTTVPVPLGKWFLVELYAKRSTGPDGRFFIAVDGTTLFDESGANTSGSPLNRIFFPLSYGSLTPKWIDDIEMWDSPPCQTLPCGP